MSLNLLNRSPNIADPDGFYEQLIAAQCDLSDEQADMLLAKLVLILANHIGDRAVLAEALELARSNTLDAHLLEPTEPTTQQRATP